MKCAICNGNLEKSRVKLELWVESELVIVEDTPADVCSHCGEKYVSAKVSKEIDNLLEQRSKAKKKIQVPVLSLAESVPTPG